MDERFCLVRVNVNRILNDQVHLAIHRIDLIIAHQQVGGPFPFEQIGAISTTRGHHWIIKDNTVSWVNGVGIDVGRQHPRWPQPPVVGFHIVRRNVLTDIGICGIAGLGPGRGKDFGVLIEDNLFVRNAFHDVERLYETAAIKTHNNVRCLIRRNLITDTLHGPGIWVDFNIQFSRCTQNVIVGTRTIHGVIFAEASYQPNLIDQNVIFNTTGHGIYEHDSTDQTFAHNLIAYSSSDQPQAPGGVCGRSFAHFAVYTGQPRACGPADAGIEEVGRNQQANSKSPNCFKT